MPSREIYPFNREQTNAVYGAGEFGFLMPSRTRYFSLLQNVQMPNQPPIQWVLQFFPGSKAAGL